MMLHNFSIKSGPPSLENCRDENNHYDGNVSGVRADEREAKKGAAMTKMRDKIATEMWRGYDRCLENVRI
jgi:hypothetical protein